MKNTIPQYQLEQIDSYIDSNKNSLKSVIDQKYDNVKFKLELKQVELKKKIKVISEAIQKLDNYKKKGINKRLFDVLSTDKAKFSKNKSFSWQTYFYIDIYLHDRYITINNQSAYIDNKEQVTINDDEATPEALKIALTGRLEYLETALDKNILELVDYVQAIDDAKNIDALIENYNSKYSYTLRQALKAAYITRL